MEKNFFILGTYGMDRFKYLYRRQFILGPSFNNSISGWTRIEINRRLFIYVHPDLHVTKIFFKHKFIILMGYILNPYVPEQKDSDIILEILKKINNVDDVFQIVSSMCGRYVLVIGINNELKIFSDAAGLRQIFYYRNESSIWCASQPSLIAEYCDITIDEDVEKELELLPLFSETSEYWFPGNLSVYRNVYHLTPNHYLDINSGAVVRYWPRKRLESITISNCLEISSKILQGVFKAACNRFRLAFGITAGLDTRILLAACKEVIHDIYFFTHTHKSLNRNGADITIPKSLFADLGLKHHVLDYFNDMSDDFKYYFYKNVTYARKEKGINA